MKMFYKTNALFTIGLMIIGKINVDCYENVTSLSVLSIPKSAAFTARNESYKWPVLEYDPVTLGGEANRIVFSCHKCGSSLTGRLMGRACILVIAPHCFRCVILCTYIFSYVHIDPSHVFLYVVVLNN
jgi:hypothetical protein